MLKRVNNQKKFKLPLSQWLFHPWQNSPEPAELFPKYPSDPPLVNTVGLDFPDDVDTTTALDLSPSLTDSPRWSIGSRDRLFLPDADVTTGSLIEEARLTNTACTDKTLRFHGSLLEMLSSDPIEDFKRSMEEMLESYHVEKNEPLDWGLLEELLQAYLEVNEKAVYRYIFAAFFDVTVELCHRQSASKRNVTVLMG